MNNLQTIKVNKLIVLGSFIAFSLALFFLIFIRGITSAATQIVNIPDSSWVDAPNSSFNPGFGPSNGGFINSGTAAGWQEDFSTNPSGYTESPGASTQLIVPTCVTGDIKMTLTINYEQINPNPTHGSGTASAGEFVVNIINESLSIGDFATTGPSSAEPFLRSGQLSASYTITKAQYDTEDWGFVIGFDQARGAHWRLFNRLATVTYDNSSCAPLSTSPDIFSTPPSNPTTINILGNDSGSNLVVSKIDGQAITPGQTITLTNGSGTVKLNNDGTITFTPASGFTGESSFNYSITDGTNTVDTGLVKITVFEPGKGSQSSTVKVPNSGFVVVSLLLIPIGIGSIAYLFISHKHKNLIRKKSER